MHEMLGAAVALAPESWELRPGLSSSDYWEGLCEKAKTSQQIILRGWSPESAVPEFDVESRRQPRNVELRSAIRDGEGEEPNALS